MRHKYLRTGGRFSHPPKCTRARAFLRRTHPNHCALCICLRLIQFNCAVTLDPTPPATRLHSADPDEHERNGLISATGAGPSYTSSASLVINQEQQNTTTAAAGSIHPRTTTVTRATAILLIDTRASTRAEHALTPCCAAGQWSNRRRRRTTPIMSRCETSTFLPAMRVQ